MQAAFGDCNLSVVDKEARLVGSVRFRPSIQSEYRIAYEKRGSFRNAENCDSPKTVPFLRMSQMHTRASANSYGVQSGSSGGGRGFSSDQKCSRKAGSQRQPSLYPHTITNGCSLRRRPRPQQGPRRLHRQGRQHQLHDGVAAPRQQVRALPRVSQISGPSSPFFCFASACSPPETRAKAARISTIVALMFAELDLCTLCALFGLPRRWGAHLDPRRQRSDAAPDREIIRQLSLEKGFILRDHRLLGTEA